MELILDLRLKLTGVIMLVSDTVWAKLCDQDTKTLCAVVHVTNELVANGTGIHFHGVRQFGTNFADGAISETECPISVSLYFLQIQPPVF